MAAINTLNIIAGNVAVIARNEAICASNITMMECFERFINYKQQLFVTQIASFSAITATRSNEGNLPCNDGADLSLSRLNIVH